MINPYYTTYTVKYRFPNTEVGDGYLEKAGKFMMDTFECGFKSVKEFYQKQIEAEPAPPVNPVEEAPKAEGSGEGEGGN